MRRNSIHFFKQISHISSRVEMQTLEGKCTTNIFFELLGCVFQEDAPFCWTLAKTMLGFLFCEVIESLGCKIRQGCKKKKKKTSKRRQRCAEFTQRLLTALLLCAIFGWHASAYCRNVRQTGGLFAQPPWEPKSFPISAHSCVACQECLTFFPSESRAGSWNGPPMLSSMYRICSAYFFKL